MAPSLAPREWLKSVFAHQVETDSAHQAFPMSLADARLTPTYNGSAALFQATQHLNLTCGDVVLLPAYCCGAEIGPFEYIGCEMLFYDVDKQLNADLAQIERILNEKPSIKAVLITHYFGFAQKHTQQILTLCNKANTALVEDCAHALYCSHENTPLGSYGSYAIFSPRKSLPLCEGGLLLTNEPSMTKARSPERNDAHMTKPDLGPWLQRVCYSIQQYFRSTDPTLANNFVSIVGIGLWAVPAVGLKVLKKLGLLRKANWLTADAEGDQAIPIYNTAMSRSMNKILKLSNTERIITTRRSHYELWLSELSSGGAQPQAQPLFKELPDGCCPLYFPLIVNNPAKIVAALQLNDIESFNWWQHMHPAVDWHQFPVAHSMKQRIVALPTHQKMSTSQVKKAAACVIMALNNSL